MSEPFVFQRRDFLKLLGVGAAGMTAGCAQPPERLIPYLVPPEDMLPGIPYWYASTCTECPSGCGILVKTREGRAIKIEGNPAHPVNRGGLCSRGHAALQGLYDPDRLRTPMVKEGGGWKAITWDDALALAARRLSEARSGGKGVALVTHSAPGSYQALAQAWAGAAGGTHLAYEPLAPHALREANRRTFGRSDIPHYDFARAGMVLSFGADFLETWLNPTAYARDFAEMRKRPEARFVAIEPRLSLTAANADEWIAVRPGGEMAVALGIAHVMLAENLSPVAASRGAVLDAVSAYSPEAVEAQTDVPAATLQRVARAFAARRPSLAVGGGIAGQSEQSVATAAAVNLLNYVAGNLGETVRFDRAIEDDGAAALGDLQQLGRQMSDGTIGVLVVHEANPVYASPAWTGFAAALDKVPFKVSLSGVLDETAERCDLLLPSQHALESLGDSERVRGVVGIVQPAMQRVPAFDARPAGDTLIALARAGGFGASFPDNWNAWVQQRWRDHHGRYGGGEDFDTFWRRAVQRGGVWRDVDAPSVGWSGAPAFAAPQLRGSGELALVLYPSPNLYDGRGANKPWLQELPDPTTKAVWGSWAEIHPETAAKLGVAHGDNVKVETEAGSVQVPAYLYAGVRKDVVAIPLGQGHAAYGRYAKGRGANALALLGPAQESSSGAIAYLSAKARVSKAPHVADLVVTQRNKSQAGREIARIIPVAALMGAAATTAGAAHATAAEPSAGHGAPAHGAAGAAAHHAPAPSQTRLGKHTEPRQRAAGEKTPPHAVHPVESAHIVRAPRQIPVASGSYGSAQHQHRWAMAIDIDSCTGCSACVTACNAENNIPTVGPEIMKRGREMSWLRIERFEEHLGGDKTDVRFVPMLCQHCTDAPCETVCPVYATYHNPEGLNAQVYNRCVGTRYCSNNCPYKVRAFNFFDYSAPEKETFAFPEPLNWQLNPDVTVRSKGVMEKCTFCVQRILEGKGHARDAQRPVQDGDIQTACAQSCPSQAIVFGDLLDASSKVAQLSKMGDRRYWVLDDLNTKPAITYLKKIEREVV